LEEKGEMREKFSTIAAIGIVVLLAISMLPAFTFVKAT